MFEYLSWLAKEYGSCHTPDFPWLWTFPSLANALNCFKPVRFLAFPVFLAMKSVFHVSPVSLLASRILYSLQSHSLLQFSSSTPSNSTQSLPSRRNTIGHVPPAIDNYRPKQLCITRENGHKDLNAASLGLKYKTYLF